MEEASVLCGPQGDEVLIATPSERTVRWLGLADGEYRDIEQSSLIDLGPHERAKQIDWP
jgi:hypothetical protein